MFSGEHDERDALCTIQAGEGGADAQDWAEMLYRMYVRWAERRGFEVEEEGSTPGSEAGLSSVEFLVKGRYAYGYLQAERGVHRLVRMSPFNAQGKRQTAFAALDVVPVLHEDEVHDRDRRDRPQDGRLPVVGRRRPARQHDVVGGAPHPPAHRHRRVVPDRALPAPEQGQGHGDAQGPSWPTSSGRSARTSWPASGASSSGWASAARSAATCCSRTRW